MFDGDTIQRIALAEKTVFLYQINKQSSCFLFFIFLCQVVHFRNSKLTAKGKKCQKYNLTRKSIKPDKTDLTCLVWLVLRKTYSTNQKADPYC